MDYTVLKPLITEKSMQRAAVGWYTFKVNLKSNKNEITKSVANLFNVHVTDIRTVRVKGKTKRAGRQRITKSGSEWKKALVKLKPGEKIALFAVEEAPKNK